jgi:hypothetical protein
VIVARVCPLSAESATHFSRLNGVRQKKRKRN